MPTFERLSRFNRDFAALSKQEQAAFRTAVGKLVADFSASGSLRAGVRVKGVQGAPGIFELTWADDGRATFSFGKSVRGDDPHVVWRRVGTHDVLRNP